MSQNIEGAYFAGAAAPSKIHVFVGECSANTTALMNSFFMENGDKFPVFPLTYKYFVILDNYLWTSSKTKSIQLVMLTIYGLVNGLLYLYHKLARLAIKKREPTHFFVFTIVPQSSIQYQSKFFEICSLLGIWALVNSVVVATIESGVIGLVYFVLYSILFISIMCGCGSIDPIPAGLSSCQAIEHKSAVSSVSQQSRGRDWTFSQTSQTDTEKRSVETTECSAEVSDSVSFVEDGTPSVLSIEQEKSKTAPSSRRRKRIANRRKGTRVSLPRACKEESDKVVKCE